MKKMVIWFITMMTVIISVTTANAVGENYATIVDYLNEWCTNFGYEEYICGTYCEGIGELTTACSTCVIDVQEYERHYNNEFTWDNFKRWSRDGGDYISEIMQIGEIEGNKVYVVEATTENNIGYYLDNGNLNNIKRMKVIVMLYDNDY